MKQSLERGAEQEIVADLKVNAELEAEVAEVLAQVPAVRIPEGFAARVAAAAVAQPVAKVRVRRRLSLGRSVAAWAMAVIAVALFVVAPMAGTRVQSWPFALEMVLLVQLAAVGLVMQGVRNRE